MIRIILVEADPTSAQDIQSRLQRVSYDVIATTATLGDVIERAHDLQPDIILMDIRMKGERDNIEVAREIKKRHNVPIIFIAPDTDVETVRKAIAAEPDGFLIEPLDERELFAAIEVAIHKHQKEQEALASERRIRELTDALPEVVYETDARGAFAFVNAMCLHTFGYTKEELQAGMTVFDVLVPEDRDRGRRVFSQRMNAQQLGWVEYTGLRKDGSTFSISLCAVPIRNDGVLDGVRGIIVDVSQRKKAEEALQNAHNGLERRVQERTKEIDATNDELSSTNERLRAALLYARSLIEASLDPLVTVSAQGTITDVNKATEDVTGFSREELIGSDFSDYFTEPDKADAGYKQVFTDGFVRDYPLALRHTSGRITEVLYNATLFRNEAGEIQGVFAAARDVTERKRAEEQVRTTSLYARNLIEASLDPLVTISAEGKITDVNKATEEVTGYLRHELIGSDFSDYFTEPSEARKGYEQVFANGFVKDYPLRIRHKSGILTDVLYNATLYRNEAGEVQGVFAAARDVTERKRAEGQLRATSLYARSLIEASLDPLVTISAEGKITDVNKATEEVTGYLRHELIGSDFSDYFTEPDDAKAGYQQVFADGYVRDYPLALRHKSGWITDVLYNATVYRNEAGKVQGVFAAARDITDRKRAEAAVQEYARRQEIINHIIKAGNEASSPQTAVRVMLDAAMELLDVTHGSIYLLNEAESMIELQYACGFSDAVLDASRRFPITTSYYPTVYDGKAVFLDDYAKEGTEQFRAMLPELHAMAIVPLVAHDHVIGNYVLSSGRTRPFTDEERAILVAVGQQAGTVVGRLQAEEVALQRATMLDGAHDAIVMWDRHDNITYWNHGAERLYGWTRDEAIGKHVHSLLKTTFPEPLERINFTLSETGRWEGELIHKTCENTVVIVESHMTLQHTLDGTLVATLEINNDVTQQRQAEEQLRASSLYARSLIEASLDPLVTISAEGKITDVNKATEDVTGFSREELIGSDFSNYFTEQDEANAGYRRVFTDGYVRDYPLAIRHRSGSVTDVLYNATLYQNEAGEVQGVFAAARDITDRKRAEDKLQSYSEHLEELVEERTSQLKDAERMAGIGETAAMIGHDLRNPLQGLQYVVDLQKMRTERISPEERGVQDWENVAVLFDRISEQVFYMDKIVGDLQDYARPITPEHEALSVGQLISDVLESIPHADGVRIVTNIPDLRVMADPHLMRRVFGNLILNAIQAMPDGGTLTVSASAEDGSVAIRVHDTGGGVSDELKGKLFKPLFTGKAKGTGLGLAVVKRIIDAHGGTISFESVKGMGTTFTVTLPSSDAR